MELILSKVQNQKEIKSIIYECFTGDDELVSKYHIRSGTTLEECVEDTYEVLNTGTDYDFEFYKVLNKWGVVCGFIGVEPDSKSLTTFCLKMRYRVKEYKEALWNVIIKIFKGENFSCGLYKKNERAINYLIRNGCEIKSESYYNQHPIVIVNFKKEALCH